MREIATGTSFPGLVAKSLARQFSKEVERACAPFQFAFSKRTSTDCVEHVMRALTDASPTATISLCPVREGHAFGAITLHLVG